MKVKVKICGIKTLETAQAAFEAGADFLGFNFVKSSKRYIEPKLAKEIISKLPKTIKKVGVFMNADAGKINQLINDLKLDYVQLHGDESPQYIGLIKNAGVIKTFSLGVDFAETEKKMKNYKADYFLLDREEQGRGKLLNPDKVRELTSIFPIILAGGLTPKNVTNAVRLAKPQVVDVAGGVETDGEKDKDKIIEFIEKAKSYDI